jgi:hypothetical protein
MAGRQSPANNAPSLRSLDFAHIPVVNAGHLTIVPGDRDRVPTRFSDLAAVGVIASPANAVSLLEISRFGGGHFPPSIAWIARKPKLSFLRSASNSLD